MTFHLGEGEELDGSSGSESGGKHIAEHEINHPHAMPEGAPAPADEPPTGAAKV